jgi:hypothetical protein
MEPESSLPHSQAPTICPYPEPEQSSQCLTVRLLEDPLNTTLPSTSWSSKLSLSPGLWYRESLVSITWNMYRRNEVTKKMRSSYEAINLQMSCVCHALPWRHWLSSLVQMVQQLTVIQLVAVWQYWITKSITVRLVLNKKCHEFCPIKLWLICFGRPIDQSISRLL